jgi:hypothetical protein
MGGYLYLKRVRIETAAVSIAKARLNPICKSGELKLKLKEVRGLEDDWTTRKREIGLDPKLARSPL